MKRALTIRLRGGAIAISLRLHLDVRGVDAGLAREMVVEGLRGISRMGPLELGGAEFSIELEVESCPHFSLYALNMRVYDIVPVRRGFLNPRINVSRAYPFSAWPGACKLLRRLLGMPDIFINLGGRRIGTPAGMAAMRSVVLHEFGHVLGFKDKYRGKKGKKRSPGVQDGDLMYRTGSAQRFLPYQLELLLHHARRGRLTLKRV